MSTSEGGLDDLHQDTIDNLYSFITNFRSLSDENKELFVEALTDLSSHAIDSIIPNMTVTAKNTRKIIIFFLVEFLRSNEQFEKSENAEQQLQPNNGNEKITKSKSNKKSSNTPGKGKNGRNSSISAKNTNDSSFNWIEWRHCCLKLVHQVLIVDLDSIKKILLIIRYVVVHSHSNFIILLSIPLFF